MLNTRSTPAISADVQPSADGLPHRALLPTWRELVLIAVSVLAYMALASFLLPPRYVTVDDSFHDFIAAGVAIAERPDSHLAWVHCFLGIVLSTLYKINSAIPFYPLLLLSTQYLANCLICATIWSIYRTRLALIPIGLYLISVATPVLAIFQFSSTSAIAGIAGGVLAGTALECGNVRVRRQMLAAGIAMFILGILIRPRMGLIVIASFMVVMVSKYALLNNNLKVASKKLSGAVILAACLTATLFGLQSLDGSYYTDEWAEFGKLRYGINPIFDWGRASSPDNASQLAAAGWSKHDFQMIRAGLMFDPDICSSARYDRLTSVCPPYRGDWRRELPIKFDTVRKDPVVLLSVILALAGSLILSTRQISARRFLLICVGIAALTVAVAFFTKLARHAYMPMFFTLGLVALTHLDMQLLKKVPLQNLVNRAATIFLIFIVGKMMVNFYQIESAQAQVSKQEEMRFQSVVNYLHSQPDKLAFALHASGILPSQMVSPFETLNAFRGLKLVTSFSSYTPSGQELMRSHGVKDFASGLLLPDSLLLSDNYANRLLRRYFREHKNIAVDTLKQHITGPKGLGVYRVVPHQP